MHHLFRTHPPPPSPPSVMTEAGGGGPPPPCARPVPTEVNLCRPHYVTPCEAGPLPKNENREAPVAMASTPSASALSAVLRCRGKIWTRNPSAKRPAPAAYGLGLAGAALREPSAERGGSSSAAARGGSSSAAARRLLPPGERGGLLSVACRWVTQDTFTQDSEKMNKLLSPKLSSGSARAAAPRGQQHSHVRKTTSHLPGRERCSKLTSVLPLELVTYVPRRVLKVTVTSPWSMGSTSPGWKKLRSACVTLTALLVSRLSGLCAWSSAHHPQVRILQVNLCFRRLT